MRAHEIENGKVTNTIVVESLDSRPNLISADNGGTIGDSFDGQTFTTPEIVISPPNSVPKYAAIKILKKHDKYAAVETMISNISDADIKETFEILFKDHPEWSRTGPFMSMIIAANILTESQIDEYFIEADDFVQSINFSQG